MTCALYGRMQNYENNNNKLHPSAIVDKVDFVLEIA